MKVADRILSLLGLQMPTPLSWQKRGGSLAKILNSSFRLPTSTLESRIEKLARDTQRGGALTLWERYLQPGAVRFPDTVRSDRNAGRFYSWLVTTRRPNIVVEFGTAFGVSGMYWLSGLLQNDSGILLTFEPNERWREIAVRNLTAIGGRFKSYLGTFEDNVQAALDGRSIDIAFIDAIHTSEWVLPQFEIVCRYLAPKGIVVLDDIDFSPDMAKCWLAVAADPRVVAAVRFGERVGILEFQ